MSASCCLLHLTGRQLRDVLQPGRPAAVGSFRPPEEQSLARRRFHTRPRGPAPPTHAHFPHHEPRPLTPMVATPTFCIMGPTHSKPRPLPHHCPRSDPAHSERSLKGRGWEARAGRSARGHPGWGHHGAQRLGSGGTRWQRHRPWAGRAGHLPSMSPETPPTTTPEFHVSRLLNGLSPHGSAT